MSRKTKAQRLSDIHATALEQFDDAYNASWPDRALAVLARRFADIRGAQWDWDEAGDFEVRMKLEGSPVTLACTRINNEYRQNQISAQFIPKDGSDADALADLCASRYRADFQDSNGREARDNAFDELVKGGMGAWRFRSDYEVDGKSEQRVCIEPINDAATTVYFDANSKRKDKRDAGHVFLLRPYTRRAYEALWGVDATTFPTQLLTVPKFNWFGIELIYVAEYFVKETFSGTRRTFTGLDGEEVEYTDDIPPEEEERLLATGYVEGEPETIEKNRIHKYTLSGAKVLSDDGIIAGKHLPVAVAYAYRTVIDGVERFRGHVSPAMDMVISSNIQFSKVTEIAAASAIEKPIFTPEQVAGHENRWDNDHTDNYAYMLLNPIIGIDGNPMPAGQIGFTKAPAIPEAVAALWSMSNEKLSEILGNPAGGEMLEGGQSGVAMGLVQARIDMQTSGYLDNFGDGERMGAEIWLSMAKDVYVEAGRKLKTMSENGKRGSVELGRKILGDDNEVKTELDFARADFDVAVEIGPSSASKRAAVVRSVTSLLGVTTDPETASMLTHAAIMNTEGEGLEDIRNASRKKMVAMGVIEPTKEEKEQAAAAAENTPPDANATLATAMAAEAEAKAELATAQVGKALADAELTQAKTAETLANIPIAQRDSAIKAAEAIQKGLNPDAG